MEEAISFTSVCSNIAMYRHTTGPGYVVLHTVCSLQTPMLTIDMEASIQ